MHYTLKDHQGSLTATVSGNTVERLSYDGWGRRRNPDGFGYDNVTHTVDRYVQQPDNSQGFNRYAYCMYNPLRYVDPTGWVMSRPNGIGTNPPNGRNGGTAKVDSVPVPTSSDTMGECAWFLLLRDVVITDYATPSSGGPSSDHLPEWSSERGWGNYGSIEGTLYYDEMEPCFGSGGGMGYYGIDIVSYAYSGRSLGGNLDHYVFDDMVIRIW